MGIENLKVQCMRHHNRAQTEILFVCKDTKVEGSVTIDDEKFIVSPSITIAWNEIIPEIMHIVDNFSEYANCGTYEDIMYKIIAGHQNNWRVRPGRPTTQPKKPTPQQKTKPPEEKTKPPEEKHQEATRITLPRAYVATKPWYEVLATNAIEHFKRDEK